MAASRRLPASSRNYRIAEAQGAILQFQDIFGLAEALGLPPAAFAATSVEVEVEVEALKRGEGRDRFGRDFRGAAPPAPPLCAVRVTGAIFHTQGGLRVDPRARVLRPDGSEILNLFVCGGAEVGFSGQRASGYLPGNGLLTAVGLGEIAGRKAARLAG